MCDPLTSRNPEAVNIRSMTSSRTNVRTLLLDDVMEKHVGFFIAEEPQTLNMAARHVG